MNFIKSLQAANLDQLDKLAAMQNEIAEFRIFLHSAKFTGVDSDGGRKDWIATGDVLRRLEIISEAGR
jgi:hypothetical protein